MIEKSTKELRVVGGGLPSTVSDKEALRYIQELADSLREMADGLSHSYLAGLLASASAEAGRLAALEEG